MSSRTTPHHRAEMLKDIARIGPERVMIHSKILEALIIESNTAAKLTEAIEDHAADYQRKFPGFEPTERDTELWKMIGL